MTMLLVMAGVIAVEVLVLVGLALHLITKGP